MSVLNLSFLSILFANMANSILAQVHGSMSSNSDGSQNLNLNLPIAGNEHKALSAIGSTDGKSAGAGLAFQTDRGNGLSVMARTIPGVANQLTAAGKLNVFQSDRHELSANAFVAHTMPKDPVVPNFNTYGGKLDYMYGGKIGGSLGVAHTDLFKKTDVSAMGNLNLFKDRQTSVDLNAGFSRSFSPYIPKSSWQPSGGISYTRYF